MNKEKLLTDIDTDKFALIFDSPVLMCVFAFLSIKCYLSETRRNKE